MWLCRSSGGSSGFFQSGGLGSIPIPRYVGFFCRQSGTVAGFPYSTSVSLGNYQYRRPRLVQYANVPSRLSHPPPHQNFVGYGVTELSLLHFIVPSRGRGLNISYLNGRWSRLEYGQSQEHLTPPFPYMSWGPGSVQPEWWVPGALLLTLATHVRFVPRLHNATL
jgi:hypothetical protein